MRASFVWLLATTGCVPSHVAAVALDGDDGVATLADDDGDDDGGDDGSDGVMSCELPALLPGCDEAADPLRAPEIACVVGISAAEFRSDDPDAWRRAHEFGNAFWVAESSSAVLVLSTGRLAQPNTAQQVTAEVGAAQLASVDNDNPDGVPLPDPIVPSPGAGGGPFVDCDGAADCSETLATAFGGEGQAHDLVWFRFDAQVPDGVFGYDVRVAVLTAEYPERIGDSVSDLFVWWTSSEAFTGNLATLDGQPANVAGLAPLLGDNTFDHPMLLRTGFDGGTGEPCSVGGSMVADCPLGAATGWMQLRGPAVPGERLRIVAALVDQGDALLDTVVLLDQWQWRCDGCVPGDSCGLSP